MNSNKLTTRFEDIKKRILLVRKGEFPVISILVDIPWLTEQLEKAIEVIWFYADGDSWQWKDTPTGDGEYKPAHHDEGDKAREFLKGLNK